MLTLEELKECYSINVFNKYLVKSYFVNKKYNNSLIKEYFLKIELSKGFKNDFTNDTTVDLTDVGCNDNNVTINNYYNTTLNTTLNGSYKFKQATTTLIWYVTHNLGFLPSEPLITDLSGNNIEGIVNNIDVNNSTIAFSHVQSGYAYFS